MRVKHTLASLSAASWADMEEGCKETCSRLRAWGSEDKAQDTLGKAMSCSLRRILAFVAASIEVDWCRRGCESQGRTFRRVKRRTLDGREVRQDTERFI
jgi:hypothetical protein